MFIPLVSAIDTTADPTGRSNLRAHPPHRQPGVDLESVVHSLIDPQLQIIPWVEVDLSRALLCRTAGKRNCNVCGTAAFYRPLFIVDSEM